MRPHLLQLPEGVLRQLAEQRLQQQTGLNNRGELPGSASSAESARPPAVPARSTGSGGVTGRDRAELTLQRRLLALLLAELDPILAALSEEEKEKMKLRVEDPLGQIVIYKEHHPTATSREIVGSYAGEAEQGELVAAMSAAPHLPSAAVVTEFREGLVRLINLAERAKRRKLLAEMDEAADPESFLRYWSLNRNGDAQ